MGNNLDMSRANNSPNIIELGDENASKWVQGKIQIAGERSGKLERKNDIMWGLVSARCCLL